MAEDFEAGVCNPTWWNLPKSPLGYWPGSSHDHHLVLEMSKARSSDSGGSVVSDQQPDSSGGVWMDSSTVEMMGINGISSPTSSPTTAWNHTIFGRRESDYNSRGMILDDMNSRLNFGQGNGLGYPSKIQKEWTSTTTTTTNGFNQTNNQECSQDHQSSPPGLIPSILLQTLFDSQPQQSLFDNRPTKYSSEFSPLEKFSPAVVKGSLAKQLAVNNPFNLTTTAPFWSTSNASANDICAGFLPSVQTQFLESTFEEKSDRPNLIAKANNEGVQDNCKKSSGGPVFKRPRIETPSPLPTFKVRKEKLGDRITALQQLVSPFGKTDTASVLQEAIEYIKFLHDQVNVLSTPYMKNGAPVHHQQMFDKLKNTEGTKKDLRSRGLCLVPISSTFPVTNETPVDFWTPTFGGTYR